LELVVAISIKNADVERLIAEISALTGEGKTETVRRALQERRERLAFRITNESKANRLRRFLEQEVWPVMPKEELGRTLTKEEEEAILGYGEEGV
jgi:antitoxin VapB